MEYWVKNKAMTSELFFFSTPVLQHSDTPVTVRGIVFV
jgi:hypothetical protein